MTSRIAATLFLALALVSMAAAADTIAFGNRVVSVGDSTGRVLEAAGQPSRVVRLENALGAAVGERWEYYQGGKTVLITVAGGRVVSIDEIRG